MRRQRLNRLYAVLGLVLVIVSIQRLLAGDARAWWSFGVGSALSLLTCARWEV